ncbi:DUF3558 family protein [Saccharopolyspora montiporae]
MGTVGLAVIGLAACSPMSGDSDTEGSQPSEAQSAGLQDFDVCNFFTPEDLAAVGVSGPGEPEDTVDFEPGCNFRGEAMDLTLFKAPEDPFDQYMSQGNFGEVNPFEVNGRKAAVGVTAGSEGQGICSTFLDAAGGTVIVTVTGDSRDSVDACGEAKKVAERIEPRLPA